MITRLYLVLIFIFYLFFFQFKKAFTEDELLYTCEYKSTEYVDHKNYGNDSQPIYDTIDSNLSSIPVGSVELTTVLSSTTLTNTAKLVKCEL